MSLGIDEAALRGALMTVERSEKKLSDLMQIDGWTWGGASIKIAGASFIITLSACQRVFPGRNNGRTNLIACHTIRGAEGVIEAARLSVKVPVRK